MGAPQEQSETPRRPHGLLHGRRPADGPGHLPQDAAAEAREAAHEQYRRPAIQALPGDRRPLRQVWRPVQLRPPHAGWPGIPGVDAQPAGQERQGGDRRDAGHAGHGCAAEGRQYRSHGAEHPRRRQAPGPADDELLLRREILGAQSGTVRVRLLQRGAKQDRSDAHAAGQRGLDPDEWFDNVEIVVSEKIGIETTTYVRNIYKYYVAYKLAVEQREL